MVDLKILELKGCTKKRLMEIFTCKDTAKSDYKLRCQLEEDVRNRIREGIVMTSRNANLYQAVDMAWDSTPIQPETIPLQLFAQGKISLETTKSALEKLSIADQFCTKSPSGEIKSVDVPRLFEVTFSLIRSYCLRRLAAQSSRFANLWPYFKYDPRGTSLVDKLRADVTSGRMDAMSDQYGYRHLGDQCIREMFLYAHSVVRPTCAWDRKANWRREKDKDYDKVENKSELTFESYVEREGVEYINTHPTRTYWDRSSPLALTNTDNGPDWIGDWNIVRFGSVWKNPDFFNRDSISGSDSLATFIKQNPAFFGFYFDPKVITAPDFSGSAFDTNDRTLNAQVYGANEKDKGLFLNNIAMRVNPKRLGIADFPFDVWMRLVVASDDTVVFAEFLPSLPAAYGGINEHDGRLINPSMAHDLMAFQDQCTNILSQLLMTMKISLFQIWLIDQDALEPNVKKYIEDTLAAKNYYVDPIKMFYSGSKLKDETNVDPSKMIQIIRANMTAEISTAFDSVMKLLQIAERLMVMSPNETGQPNPREVSARETQQIATSVDSIYSFIANGIDEQRAAMKKICYESTLSCSTAPFKVPATTQYSKKTVQKAGFDVEDTDEDIADDKPFLYTIISKGTDLGYEQRYTGRDGDERVSDTASASALTQLLQTILASPPLAQKVGGDRLMDMVQEISRKLGVFDLNFELGEGEDGAMGMDPQQLQQVLQLFNDRLAKIEQAVGLAGPQAPQGSGGPASAPAPQGAPAAAASGASVAPVDAAPVQQQPVAA